MTDVSGTQMSSRRLGRGPSGSPHRLRNKRARGAESKKQKHWTRLRAEELIP